MWGYELRQDQLTGRYCREEAKPLSRTCVWWTQARFQHGWNAIFFDNISATNFFVFQGGLCHHPGDKPDDNKDCLFVFVGTSADGSLEVPLVIIGNPTIALSFHMEKSPLRYVCYQKPWSNKCTSREWFFSLFLPFVRARALSSKGWCLLWTKLRQMTRCSGTWLFGRVLLTSQLHRYSSIDGRKSDCSIGGVLLVKPFGTNYGRIAYETTLAVICQNLPKGMNVIHERHGTNAVDAARISKYSWEDIPGHKIVHCWGNAGVLPPTRQSFKIQWAKCMLRIAMRWMILKVAYRVCKWCAYISTKYRILSAKRSQIMGNSEK